jgi:glycosyltransferase involved in cell wall biosynthesis
MVNNDAKRDSIPSKRRLNPKISIITVTLNAGEFFSRSLKSVIDQKYNNVEYIVIDGGSVDSTLETLHENESRISYWISEKDSGIYNAMNKGIRHATGDWLYFLGADDVLINCLSKVAVHLRNSHTIYYGDVYLPTKNKVYSGKFSWEMLVHKNINHQSIFYPRQVFEHYQYNLKYPMLADYELNLRCWSERKFRFKYIPILICVHNDTGRSSIETDNRFIKDKKQLVNTLFGKRIYWDAKRQNLLNTMMKIPGIKTLKHLIRGR